MLAVDVTDAGSVFGVFGCRFIVVAVDVPDVRSFPTYPRQPDLLPEQPDVHSMKSIQIGCWMLPQVVCLGSVKPQNVGALDVARARKTCPKKSGMFGCSNFVSVVYIVSNQIKRI